MSKAVCGLVLALGPFAAQARVIDAKPAGFTIENEVTVPVDAATAWQTLVTKVDDWWPKEHSWFGKDGQFRIEPRAGGCFCEISGKREVLHMTVTFVDEGKLLRMVGGLGPLQGMGLSGTMDWRFAPADGGGSRITLRYVAGGYTTEDLVKFAPIVDKVQALQLGGLQKFLAKKSTP